MHWDVSLTSVTAFLAEHFDDLDADSVVILNAGAWSQAFRFSRAGTNLVIRWSRQRENFVRDQLASQHRAPALPIPQVYELGEHAGWYYAVSEFARGSYLEAATAAELDALVPAISQMLIALHDADVTASQKYGYWLDDGHGTFGSWQDFLRYVREDHAHSMIAGWRENLERSSWGMSEFDGLYRELEKRVTVCAEARHLIHSDLLNFNVLVQGSDISAVLDWGSSKYGDFLYDLAWFSFYAPWYPQFADVNLIPRLREALQSAEVDWEYAKERELCYHLHIGLDSIAYNAFRQNWEAAQEVAQYTRSLLSA